MSVNPHPMTWAFLAGLLLWAAVVLLRAVRRAPVGYEDDEGFHDGSQPGHAGLLSSSPSKFEAEDGLVEKP